MLVVVLKAWVTETNETPCASKSSTSLAKSVSDRVRRHLVDDDHVDAAGADLAEQPLQRRSLHRSAREAAIVVAGRQAAPAFMGLALDVSLGCLALAVERVELLLEPVLG